MRTISGGHDHHDHSPPAGHDRAFAIGIALNLGFVFIEAAPWTHCGFHCDPVGCGHNRAVSAKETALTCRPTMPQGHSVQA